MTDRELTQEKLHARLRSTAELLTELADESQRTLQQTHPNLMNTENWLAYRNLTNALHQNAATAGNLAEKICQDQQAEEEAQAA